MPDGLELPRIDRHSVLAHASVDATFDALWRTLRGSFGGAPAARYARLIRCADVEVVDAAEPIAGRTTVVGFHVTNVARPLRIELSGAHHFSSYVLAFDLEPTDEGTRIHATTHAAFPGALGRVYRAAVLGTRMHVLVTRRMLRAAARRAEGQRRDSAR